MRANPAQIGDLGRAAQRINQCRMVMKMFHVADCNYSYCGNATHAYAERCNDVYMSEPIAKRIKRYRTDPNLTQQQVADSIGTVMEHIRITRR